MLTSRAQNREFGPWVQVIGEFLCFSKVVNLVNSESSVIGSLFTKDLGKD